MPKGPLSKFTRTKRCPHVHVSGRRCPQRISPKVLLCGLHKAGTCSECQAMLDAFEPKNGWPTRTGEF